MPSESPHLNVLLIVTEVVSAVVAAPLNVVVLSLQLAPQSRLIPLWLTGSSREPLTPGTAHGETGGETLAGGRTGEQTNLLDWLSSPQTAHHTSTLVQATIRHIRLLHLDVALDLNSSRLTSMLLTKVMTVLLDGPQEVKGWEDLSSRETQAWSVREYTEFSPQQGGRSSSQQQNIMWIENRAIGWSSSKQNCFPLKREKYFHSYFLHGCMNVDIGEEN